MVNVFIMSIVIKDFKLLKNEFKVNEIDDIKEKQLFVELICVLYFFDEFSDLYRYKLNFSLQFEIGSFNFIDLIYEFKVFTNIERVREEDIKMKFSNEVFRFVLVCMNLRINGIIYFGVKDKFYGKIVGVKVSIVIKEIFIDYFNLMIQQYFEDYQV